MLTTVVFGTNCLVRNRLISKNAKISNDFKVPVMKKTCHCLKKKQIKKRHFNLHAESIRRIHDFVFIHAETRV